MKVQFFFARCVKLYKVLQSPSMFVALFRYGVLAGAEHKSILIGRLATVIDIGANRGQFSLAVRRWASGAKVLAFEPLPIAAARFRAVFSSDPSVRLYEAAIGAVDEVRIIHVSGRDDSSSLLPISSLQTSLFPGTAQAGLVEVRVAPLDDFINVSEIIRPAMLKLDVQGFEFNALLGCERLLPVIDKVYCECSFVELYIGQKLAAQVIAWLSERGFTLSGIHNCAYDGDGQCVQADFLFERAVSPSSQS